MSEEQQSIEELVEEKLIQQLKSAEETKRGVMLHVPALKAIATVFRGEVWEEHVPWFSLQSYEAFVVLHKVEDINEILKKIHGPMRKAGYVPTDKFDKETLTWRWKPENREEGTPYPDIRIVLSLADGGKCKMVQISTKEVPVYEVQCDGEEIVAPEIPEDTGKQEQQPEDNTDIPF